MKGDHIRVFRGSYWHHGIDIGNNQVIHFTGPKGKGSSDDIKLRKTSINDFSPTGIYFTVDYNEKCNSADETVRIAEVWLKSDPKYDVIVLNCEHFARICKTNEWESSQIDFVQGAVEALGDFGEEFINTTESTFTAVFTPIEPIVRAPIDFAESIWNWVWGN